MEDGVNLEDKSQVKMGASGNSNNVARLAALQERKKTIEEVLAERNQELRELCIQEAELTGIMPLEIPLKPGESPPTFRRRVGTSFQLPQNLLNNLSNKEESIVTLEIQKQIQANLAEAALGLANEPNVNKTIRRQHMLQYQLHKQQYNALEEKLAFLKTRVQISKQSQSLSTYNVYNNNNNNNNINNQQKYKKKPRPTEQDDNISINANVVDPFGKTVFRHSMRSLQHPMTNENSDNRHSSCHQKLAYRSSDNTFVDSHMPYSRREDDVASGLNTLSISDGRDSQYEHSQSNPNLYNQLEHVHVQHSQINSATLPHVVQRSPQTVQPYHFNQHDCNKYNTVNSHGSISNSLIHRQSSSLIQSTQKIQYYPATVHGSSNYRQSVEQHFWKLNSQQIQPHQQYEHNVMTAGLGGYWKRSDNGEMFWYTPTSPDMTWQKEKKFGSLDRRKNKRANKRTSPPVDSKQKNSLCLKYPDFARTVPVKVTQIVNIHRNRQDNRQLVRTQSLGSVGVQTVDSVWPSDDNSSCESDVHSINELNANVRKQKQKDWYETSLDTPSPSTTTITLPCSQSIIPSGTTLTAEEKYSTVLVSQPASPQASKPILEIPAETKPSLRIPDANLELFNNNIPKNCTVVQAGLCKPYHEETKPFEMSDFYKYSTKFKKSPVQHQDTEQSRNQASTAQRNLNEGFEDEKGSIIHKGLYQALQPMKCQPYVSNNTSGYSGSTDNTSSLNGSLDLSQLASNVADNFTAEMNAWYQNHEQKVDSMSRPQKTRSTATLV